MERRLEEDIANAEVPPRGDQVPPLLEEVNYDQVPINPPPLTDENIMFALFQMARPITTQAQAATTQSQAMKAQANLEVIPRAHQKVATTASCLKHFTRMNPPTFNGSNVEEYPQEFIDEIYKILYAMGLSTNEKVKFVPY